MKAEVGLRTGIGKLCSNCVAKTDLSGVRVNLSSKRYSRRTGPICGEIAFLVLAVVVSLVLIFSTGRNKLVTGVFTGMKDEIP